MIQDSDSRPTESFDAEDAALPSAPALRLWLCAVLRHTSSIRRQIPPGNSSMFVRPLRLSRFLVEQFECSSLSRLCVSRNVAGLGGTCLADCHDLQIVASDSHLVEISLRAFPFGRLLRSIALAPFVHLLDGDCFSFCQPRRSAMYERPRRLATIDHSSFLGCESWDWFSISASVTTIRDAAVLGSGIRSIEIEKDQFHSEL
jgi:hypothetical protein